ncbi:MAG: adenylate/guanylate cyclase domain-containing protein [Alphaproteobacteria bacterium]|nr:adenylate/guanylate cyclase domain-containing protein [Alphaproteobacteria bacterium]
MLSNGPLVQRLRLWSGLVLFIYVTLHLLNHSLGIVSLEAMEAMRLWQVWLWRSVPGTLLLAGAALTHAAMALAKLYRRRTLRMPAWEAVQLVLGLLIPLLLTQHVLGTRGVVEMFAVRDTYAYVLLAHWSDDLKAIRQAALLAIVWVHGCIGLHFWLRLKPWYRRLVPGAYAVAVLLPATSLIGWWDGGRAIRALALDRAWVRALFRDIGWPGDVGGNFVYGNEPYIVAGFLVLVGCIAVARLVRARLAALEPGARITYPGGRTAFALPGMTVLEASRAAGIPHASVCGGRGRCSTCRVRLGAGRDRLPSADADEQLVLDRVGAPPNVRLACQIRPVAPLDVMPLIPAAATPNHAQPGAAHVQGAERVIAIMFADLRAFTSLSEAKLPYDVVFLLNQYFRAMGEAIEQSGGHVDKFIGDGIMALFGIEAGAAGCRQALAATRSMAMMLDRLNRELAGDLPVPLRMGIGLHAGRVVVGEMGYKQATTLTAIGDAVNVASRLEALTKDFACQAVISRRVAREAGIDLSAFPKHAVPIRGRATELRVHVVVDASALPEMALPGDHARPS